MTCQNMVENREGEITARKKAREAVIVEVEDVVEHERHGQDGEVVVCALSK